jgi:hypothetical protein
VSRGAAMTSPQGTIPACGHSIEDHRRGKNDSLWCFDCGRGLLGCNHAPKTLRRYFESVSNAGLVEHYFVYELLQRLDTWEQRQQNDRPGTVAFVGAETRSQYKQTLTQAILEWPREIRSNEVAAAIRCAQMMLAARPYEVKGQEIPPSVSVAGWTPPEGIETDTVNLMPELPAAEEPSPPVPQVAMGDATFGEEDSAPVEAVPRSVSRDGTATPQKRKRPPDAGPEDGSNRPPLVNGRISSSADRSVLRSHSPQAPLRNRGSVIDEEDEVDGDDSSEESDNSLVEKPSKRINRAFENVPTDKLIAVYSEMARDYREQAIKVLRDACHNDGIHADWILRRLLKPLPKRNSMSVMRKQRLSVETEGGEETAEEILAKFTQPAKPREPRRISDQRVPSRVVSTTVSPARRVLPCAEYHEKFQSWPAGAIGECRYHPGKYPKSVCLFVC